MLHLQFSHFKRKPSGVNESWQINSFQLPFFLLLPAGLLLATNEQARFLHALN
jgi:hypothetical protein